MFLKDPNVVLVQHALDEVYNCEIINKFDNAIHKMDYFDLYKRKHYQLFLILLVHYPLDETI